MRVPRDVVALVSLAALVTAGCGSSPPHAKVQAAHITPKTMGGEVGSSAPAAGAGSKARAGGGIAGDPVRRARTGGGVSPDDHPTAARAFDPCRLVSRSEVEAATHASVARATIAPLGPTCIYRLAGSRTEITLAVESGRLSSIARSLRRGRHVSVGRHNGYCGTLGRQRLLVSVSTGRILDLVAPCTTAMHLAGRALTRLAS